jgi:peptidoglycan/xylan/chitin deacetylase (PgdA/CDA1 family)
MTTAKRLFFRLYRPFTGILPLKNLMRLSGVKRLVPLYHAVSDEAPAHLKHLYKVRTARQFENDLDIMLRYYKPVTLQELIHITGEGKPLTRPVFHVTFDDGLSEFYHVVAPILLRKGIAATCFLNNHFIDNRNMMYRLKVSILIDHLHQSDTGSASWTKFHEWVQVQGFGKTYYRKLLLELGYEDLSKIEELAAALGLSFMDYQAKYRPYLSAAQINELSSQGFTFGAHTADHIDFRELDEAEQYDQLAISIHGLQSGFTIPHKVFSFPFTDFSIRKVFFEKIQRDKLCELTFGSAGIKEDSARFNIQRVPVEEYGDDFLAELKKEYLYHILLKSLGKARINR